MPHALHRTRFDYRLSVNTPDYDPAEWLFDPDLSALQDVPKRYWIVENDLVREMTATEKAAIDLADLPEFKRSLVLQIDGKAHFEITEGSGFEWPSGSGNWFSLSLPAQIKWNGLYSGRSLLSYPLTVLTKDNTVAYDIADVAEVEQIYTAIVSFVRARLDEATATKKNVMSSTTRFDAQVAANAYLNG